MTTFPSTQRELNSRNGARINPRRPTMKLKLITATLMLMTTAASLTPRAEGAIFGDDTTFLQAHTDVIVLTDKSGQGKVALAPAWQGRVMTSTAEGDGGASFGWINRDLISSGKLQPHIN